MTKKQLEEALIYMLDCKEDFDLNFIFTPKINSLMLILGLLQNEIIWTIEEEIKKHD